MKPQTIFKRTAIYGPLVIYGVITLIPFAYMFCAAFKTKGAFFSSVFYPIKDHWWQLEPAGLTFENFTRLFTEAGFGWALLNSLFFASVTSCMATLCSAMAGFALAMYHFRLRGTIAAAVLLALVVPAALLLAPGYQLLYWMKLLNTYGGLIVPAIAPAFGVYLFRQAFVSSLPRELLEAGRIDGCSELRIFFQVALPMVRPMVGAFILLTFLGAWNNFIQPQIVLQSPQKFPLAVAVAQLRGPYQTEYGMIMAGTLVAVAPVLMLFLVLQKDFIAGLTSGSLKG